VTGTFATTESAIGGTHTATTMAGAATAPQAEKKPKAQLPGGFHWGTGRRKTAVARVRIKPGTGVVMVNKRKADQYFTELRDLNDIVAPLTATDLLKKMDVFVNVSGGGLAGQAGAVKLGLARAVMHYDAQHERKLRDLGYLTRDSRQVERKKYGRSGARRRFQFSKR